MLGTGLMRSISDKFDILQMVMYGEISRVVHLIQHDAKVRSSLFGGLEKNKYFWHNFYWLMRAPHQLRSHETP